MMSVSAQTNTQTNSLTGKNRTTAVHSGSLAFIALELITEEVSIATAGIYELKRHMGSFNGILYNINPFSANFTK